MVGFHLTWEVFLQPLILFDKVADEVDGYLSLNFYGCLTVFGVVEPCFGEPSNPEAVGIDAHNPWNVEALDVDVPVGKGVNQSLAQYG